MHDDAGGVQLCRATAGKRTSWWEPKRIGTWGEGGLSVFVILGAADEFVGRAAVHGVVGASERDGAECVCASDVPSRCGGRVRPREPEPTPVFQGFKLADAPTRSGVWSLELSGVGIVDRDATFDLAEHTGA